MSRKYIRLKPLSHIYDLSQAAANASPATAQWPSMNVMVSSNRVERRWDHEPYKNTTDNTEVTFASGDIIQAIPCFRTNSGTLYNLVLTETDISKLMTGTGETYQYLTDTYTTGTITGVSGTAVTGSGTNWATSGLAAGDKFILDSDHSAAAEPDTNWATISTIDSDTGITLSASYTGASTTGTYKARKVHTCPSGERWQYASVAGKFCFVNGNVRGQQWDGVTSYSSDINSTYCNQARYCTSYANRLVIADMYDSGDAARNPWLVRWSKEGDPTNWTDDTAGFAELIDSEEPITGLGVVGQYLAVFKKTSYYIGVRTGQATDPIQFPSQKKGIGLYAPYSLVNVAGTVAWVGLDDFYFLNGEDAEAIGDPIRKKFFDLVSDDELENVFGMNNYRHNEILWVANTSAGQYVFVYNWKDKCWSTYSFDDNITGFGGAGF